MEIILGIETSCDETGAAVVVNNKVMSNVLYSQAKMHAPHGGVVPELASRKHSDVIVSVVDKALSQAGIAIEKIDLIAVANGPGLMGSLLVGVNFAKSLSLALQKPLLGVNHVEAHLFASFIEKREPKLPALGLVVSGGHTALLHITQWGKYTLIGETVDDAAGEAFDKVAKMLDLPYPGGPSIEALAKEGDPLRFPLKGGKVKNHPLHFSFSGLKTAVLYLLKGQNAKESLKITETDKKDIAASFQEAIVQDLVAKTKVALQSFPAASLLFGGGVTANEQLRARFKKTFSHIDQYWPEKNLSLDNAAMIAFLASFQYKRMKNFSGDFIHVEAFSRFNWANSC